MPPVAEVSNDTTTGSNAEPMGNSGTVVEPPVDPRPDFPPQRCSSRSTKGMPPERLIESCAMPYIVAGVR